METERSRVSRRNGPLVRGRDVDDRFVAGLVEGRPVKWREAIERLAPLIQAVTRRLAVDYDERMDLFVHVSEKLREDDLRRLRAFRQPRGHPDGFRSFVFIVARNLALDRLRGQKGRFRFFTNMAGLTAADQSILLYRIRNGFSLRRIRHLLAHRHHVRLEEREIEERFAAIELRFSASQRWRLLSRRSLRLDALPIHPTFESITLGQLDLPLRGRESAPCDRITQQRACAALREAIGALAPRTRRVVTLRYRDGLKIREVATEVGATEKQVEHWSAEAMRALRGTLESLGVSAHDLDVATLRDAWGPRNEKRPTR